MEKKIYLPDMDTLMKMQSMGGDVYRYLETKAIESIIMRGIEYPNEGILKNTYKYLRENPHIAYPICTLYPSEVKYSQVAQSEPALCLKVLQSNYSKSKSSLDQLASFNDSAFENLSVVLTVIRMLEEELTKNPRYRFEYTPNTLVDKIFNGEFSSDIEKWMFYRRSKDENLQSLANIEPSYAAAIDDPRIDTRSILAIGIRKYAGRYQIDPRSSYGYIGKDILTHPDGNVKRLIRCIKEKNR